MSATSRRNRSKSRQRAVDVIVIDSDDDEDRKPAAKVVNNPSSHPPCISLLDDSDEENHGMSPNSKKRKSCVSSKRREDADRELAEKLQRQENVADRKLAEELQRQENFAFESKKASARKEKKAMAKSPDGKAVLAVQEIIALVKTAKEKYIDRHPALKQHSLEAVTIDDMVFFAKNLLVLQEEFMGKNISGYIDVGYHYTDQRNMTNIRTHGLLTSSDRQTNKVKATPKGSVFGDGIYTANNGTCFSNYGDTGLLVGRLKGKMVRAARYLYIAPNQQFDANTIIGDKLIGVTTLGKQADRDGWPLEDSYHEIVLRSSAQCLPMIKFANALRQHKEGKECIRYMKKSLQEILDRLFNKGLHRSEIRNAPLINSSSLPTVGVPPIPPVFPPAPLPNIPSALLAVPGAASLISQVSRAVPFATHTTAPLNTGATAPLIHQPAPSRTHRTTRASGVSSVNANTNRSHSTHQTLTYTAPRSLTTGVPSNAFTTPSSSCIMKDDCVICQDRLNTGHCVALNACKHAFHIECIRLAFKSKPQCPVCRVSIGKPQGKSPSGTMTISTSSIRCSGHQQDSLIICYNIQAGTQLNYHDKPGQHHGGKYATAYLPNNSDGKALLKRLKYSFLHGLSFTVGTSITTGAADQCTWTSVHHKTSPSGGARAHGFPDSDYFENCNGELDGLGVPAAKELDDDGKAKRK